MSRDLSRLRLGTAPDSWGVWFPQDPQQPDFYRVANGSGTGTD